VSSLPPAVVCELQRETAEDSAKRRQRERAGQKPHATLASDETVIYRSDVYGKSAQSKCHSSDRISQTLIVYFSKCRQ
jgi:predicted house-cleaning NTP pyrophosphatase (Maf/HAM1 superfamily)